MVALEFLTASLELGHEVGDGVPIIANPRLLACFKPRNCWLSAAGLHTPAHLRRGVWRYSECGGGCALTQCAALHAS